MTTEDVDRNATILSVAAVADQLTAQVAELQRFVAILIADLNGGGHGTKEQVG